MESPTLPGALCEVRRLADRAAEVIAGLKDLPGPCLPVLHALTAEFGYIHDEAIPLVADALALSQAEVVGVVEFYTDFRRTPPAPIAPG